VRNDLVGRYALILVPDDDILHAHSVTGDAGSPAASSRCLYKCARLE
jgi:hypothetical protein